MTATGRVPHTIGCRTLLVLALLPSLVAAALAPQVLAPVMGLATGPRAAADRDGPGRAVVAELLDAVARERRAAAAYTDRPGADRAGTLRAAGDATDRTAARLAAPEARDAVGRVAPERATTRRALHHLRGLAALRPRLTAGAADWSEAHRRYAAAADRLLETPGGEGRPFLRARELLDREDALLTAGRRAGALSGERREAFAAAVLDRRLTLAAALSALPDAARRHGMRAAPGSAVHRLAEAEDAVLAAPSATRVAGAVPVARWQRTVSEVRARFDDADRAGDPPARPDPGPLLVPALAALAFALLAWAAVAALLTREVRSLHRRARLPAGKAGSSGCAGRYRVRELEQVRGALERNGASDADTPGGRAGPDHLRTGLCAEVARRSRTLLHRQLALLDTMERRAGTGDLRAERDRLHQLTTHLRRHADVLLVLCGSGRPTPGWRRPVPLAVLLRTAVADSDRPVPPALGPLPPLAVSGTAAQDVAHLFAELLDGLASRDLGGGGVRITAAEANGGCVVEVRGTAAGSRRPGPESATTPGTAGAGGADGDAGAGDGGDGSGDPVWRVVSALAERHAVRVSRRMSDGGPAAEVLLPGALLAACPQREPRRRSPAPSVPPAGRLPRRVRGTARPLPTLGRAAAPDSGHVPPRVLPPAAARERAEALRDGRQRARIGAPPPRRAGTAAADTVGADGTAGAADAGADTAGATRHTRAADEDTSARKTAKAARNTEPAQTAEEGEP